MTNWAKLLQDVNSDDALDRSFAVRDALVALEAYLKEVGYPPPPPGKLSLYIHCCNAARTMGKGAWIPEKLQSAIQLAQACDREDSSSTVEEATQAIQAFQEAIEELREPKSKPPPQKPADSNPSEWWSRSGYAENPANTPRVDPSRAVVLRTSTTPSRNSRFSSSASSPSVDRRSARTPPPPRSTAPSHASPRTGRTTIIVPEPRSIVKAKLSLSKPRFLFMTKLYGPLRDTQLPMWLRYLKIPIVLGVLGQAAYSSFHIYEWGAPADAAGIVAWGIAALVAGLAVSWLATALEQLALISICVWGVAGCLLGGFIGALVGNWEGAQRWGQSGLWLLAGIQFLRLLSKYNLAVLLFPALPWLARDTRQETK